MIRPALCKPRTADSLPAPGPLKFTSTSFIPCNMAAFAASCAATVAAKAEDFLDPEKFTLPADAQEITLPAGSVIATMVLLKVALTWTSPLGTERAVFFLVFATVGFFAIAAFCASCLAKRWSPYFLLFLVGNGFAFAFTCT